MAAIVAASGCASIDNPPETDQESAAAAVVGTVGVGVGAAGGAVLGAVGGGAYGLMCGPLAIFCVPVGAAAGAVLGGVGGAIKGGKVGASAGISMARGRGERPASAASSADPVESPTDSPASPAQTVDEPAGSAPEPVDFPGESPATADTHSLAMAAAEIGRSAQSHANSPESAARDADAPADTAPEPVAPPAGSPAPAHSPGMAASEIGRSAGPAAAQTVAAVALPAPSADLPAVGTSWTYRFVDRQYRRQETLFTVRVVSNEITVTEQISTARSPVNEIVTREVLPDQARIFVQALTGRVSLIEPAPYLLAARANGELPEPIVLHGYPVGGGMPSWVIDVRKSQWEDVVVPAGRYRALRVEINGRRERPWFGHGDQLGRFRIIVWYAPEIGRYARLEHKAWSTGPSVEQAGHDQVELVSYRSPLASGDDANPAH